MILYNTPLCSVSLPKGVISFMVPIIYEHIVANATKKLEKERSIYYGNV